jgi:hypothetical protein
MAEIAQRPIIVAGFPEYQFPHRATLIDVKHTKKRNAAQSS